MHTHQPITQPMTCAAHPVAPGPRKPAEPPRPRSHPRRFCGFCGGLRGPTRTLDPPLRTKVLRVLRVLRLSRDRRRPDLPDGPPGRPRLLPSIADHHAGRTRP